MIDVIFCGYRSWAVNVIKELKNHQNVNCLGTYKDSKIFEKQTKEFEKNIDVIVCIGWSWFVPKEITEKYLCVGIHPSDLPAYRGGSPIQHQIMNGLKNTKVTLMSLDSEKLDCGDVWLKENLSLEGDNISEIFLNIENSSIQLLSKFFNQFNQLKPEKQILSQGSYFSRRKPDESRLDFDDLQNKSLQEIYDFIRCLTDPYPNAFLENENGDRLVFKEVKFIKNHKNN